MHSIFVLWVMAAMAWRNVSSKKGGRPQKCQRSAPNIRELWLICPNEHVAALLEILLKKSTLVASMLVARGSRATVAIFSSRRCHRYWEQLGKFAEVLGCCCKVELVFCAVGTSKTQSIELQDAFKMREQHLDLLSLAM